MEYTGKYNRMSQEEEEEEGEGEDEMELEDQEDEEEGDDQIEQEDQNDEEKEKGLKRKENEKKRKKRKDNMSSKKKLYKCKYAVENSSRFSLRVMEAMRSLERYENVLPISSVQEIVDYIANNYNNDGDLYAQVRTALKQLCADGFVIEVLNDEYQLIGPFRTTDTLQSCSCQTDNAKIYLSTPKYSKLKKTFSTKGKEKSHCRCKKLNENTKLERDNRKERKENISSSSRMNYYLNDMIRPTPKCKLFKSKIREDNSCKYPEIEKTLKQKGNNPKRFISYEDQHEKSIRKIQEDSADIGSSLREPAPKRMRQIDDDIITFRNLQKYQDISIAPNNQLNDRSHDNVFQEIKRSIPETSKSHQIELKKWIQRCRHECKKQNKR
uniref:DNA ligase 1-like n=1 Tax=Vespula vulgaris TaxID=7454 RepID=UPI0021338949|nr:DNA ligase 1-like [Vespula vulgaris]